MNKEERTILIEQYLDGELQGDDLKEFELQFQADKEFAQDCSLQKEIRDALSKKDIQDLREKLKAINENFEKEKQFARKKKPILIYSLSAVVIILIISSVFIFNKSYTNDELYAMYYEHNDANIQTRGEEKTTTDIYTQALKAYDNNKFIEAIKLFNQITDTSQAYIPKEYFTGLSYMELHKFDEAIMHFDPVSNDKQSAFHEDAIWYLGLCYIKTKQSELAILQFKKLLNCDSYYQKRASEILEKMK